MDRIVSTDTIDTRARLLSQITHQRHRLRVTAAALHPDLAIMLDATEKLRRLADGAQLAPLATTAGLVHGRLLLAQANAKALDSECIQALALAADDVMTSTAQTLRAPSEDLAGA